MVLLFVYLRTQAKADVANGAKRMNNFLTDRCSDPSVFDASDFPWTKSLRDNWEIIRDEFLEYKEGDNVIPDYSDISLSLSRGTPGWKTVFLRMFDQNTETSKRFPKTMALLNSVPSSNRVVSGYFSILEPGSIIHPHVGVYKGVIRYHLGLIIPKRWQQVFIVVDKKKLHWKEGEHVMFDDMYTHYVVNSTSERRVVLFLDIKRDFGSWYVNKINDAFIDMIHSSKKLQRALSSADKIDKMKNKKLLSGSS